MAARGNTGGKIDAQLDKAVAKLLKDIMKDKDAALKDKLAIIDRSLKLQAIKAKMNDADWGSGFNNTEPKGEEEDGAS